jgi:histidine ammonia-lyase
VRLTEQQQRSHQRNLLLARAVGGPPWLEVAEARPVLAVRLVTFLSGDAAVSAELCQRLADFLNEGIVPAVPRAGAGTAGEITHLAHAFGPLAGIGEVLGPAGTVRPAREVLRGRGIGEFSLGPKEGIALIQGVPGATGLCVLRLGETAGLTALMEAAAALSVAGVRASRDPYRAACARGDDILAGVLAGCGRSRVTSRHPGDCRHRCRSGWPGRCSPR